MQLPLHHFVQEVPLKKEETRQSLKLMKEKTGANYVIFAPNGVQKTAFSENIDYRTKRNVSDEELTAMIAYAKQLGLLRWR